MNSFLVRRACTCSIGTAFVSSTVKPSHVTMTAVKLLVVVDKCFERGVRTCMSVMWSVSRSWCFPVRMWPRIGGVVTDTDELIYIERGGNFDLVIEVHLFKQFVPVTSTAARSVVCRILSRSLSFGQPLKSRGDCMLISNTGTFSNELNSFQFKMVTKRSIKLPITKRNLCWGKPQKNEYFRWSIIKWFIFERRQKIYIKRFFYACIIARTELNCSKLGTNLLNENISRQKFLSWKFCFNLVT